MPKQIYSVLVFSIFLLLSACIEDESDPRDPVIDHQDASLPSQCDPSGQWDVTFTIGAGTCFSKGVIVSNTLTITITGDTFVAQWGDGTQPNVGSFDEGRCTMVLNEIVDTAQTAEILALRGTETTTIQFDDQSFTGVSSLDVDTYDSGAMVGSCTQGANLVGEHR